jgi:hypothetical protein
MDARGTTRSAFPKSPDTALQEIEKYWRLTSHIPVDGNQFGENDADLCCLILGRVFLNVIDDELLHGRFS